MADPLDVIRDRLVRCPLVDVLTGLLDGPRAHGAFLLRVLLSPPWSIRVCDEAPLSITAVVRGDAWFVPDEGPSQLLDEHDAGIVLGPDHYTVASHPGLEPQIVIHPGQRCTTVDGVDVHALMDQGVRTWGNDPDGATELVVGTYLLDTDVSRRLLGALPQQLVVRAGDLDPALLGVLAAELARDAPGQRAVLDRLLDLLLITTVRAWFDRSASDRPGWYAATSDPVVGHAVRVLHDDPSCPWTVASLAAKVGVSRSVLARRFTDLVGQPPIDYLTDWRMSLATDWLREPGATVSAVASKVGYSTPYAFSTAYKRARGITPAAVRRSVGVE
jgi:AraC-like DNA-binding protein